MKLDKKKKENEFPKYTEDQVRSKSSVLVDSVDLKGLFQSVEDGGREKIQGEKKYSGLWKTKVQNERELGSGVDQRTFECVLCDGFS